MDNDELVEVRGVVTHINYNSPTFSAGRFRPVGQTTEKKFAGKVFVKVADQVVFRGAWTEHDKYGRQFTVQSLAYEEKLDADGLAVWLATHEAAVGIGPVKARRIAQEYGEDFGRILKEDPRQIAISAQVPLAAVRHLAGEWAKREEYNVLATKLAALGLSRGEIEKLHNVFGNSVLGVLEKDPYMVVGRVDGFGFARVDDIAQRLGVPKQHPGRMKAGLSHALTQEALRNGSTCDVQKHVLDVAEDLLKLDVPGQRQIIGTALHEMTGRGELLGFYSPAGETFYALHRHVRHEEAVYKFLRRGGDPNPLHPSLKHVLSGLDESQAAAVLACLRHRCVVITGPAGSGKTTIARSIAEIYGGMLHVPEGYDPFVHGRLPANTPNFGVVACAPTGKAARRLTQSTGMEAMTIHKLLDYHPVLGFRRNERDPIDERVVIVDEFSMVDVELASNLFRAVRPDAAVVLIGDHHQLPPVGPGAILRDCLEYDILPTVVLRHCHRQAGVLRESCGLILEGKVAPTADKNERGFSPWIVHDRLKSVGEVLACVEKLFNEVLAKWGWDLPWDVQFMSPLHKGPLGTAALNVLLQKLHQEANGVTVAPTSPDRKPRLYVGDKVICTKNNYALNVMNGHQGKVMVLDPLTVQFDDRTVVIPNDCKGDIDLAYCLTPHKMQGSEVPVAVTIAHSLHGHMLHRNWAYTAATRAREQSIIVGDCDGVEQAVTNVVTDNRKTVLGLLHRPNNGE